MSKTLEAVDAVLAVDVGNTRIGMGVWDDDGLHQSSHVSNDQPGSWGPALEEVWGSTLGVRKRAIVIGSVSPPVARQFADLASEACDCEPLMVRDDGRLIVTLP